MPRSCALSFQVGHACWSASRTSPPCPPPLSDPALHTAKAARAAAADERRDLLSQYEEAKATVADKRRAVNS